MPQRETRQPPFHGSCLCGKIRFVADALHSQVAYCHCSMCRKFHGAPAVPIVAVDRDAFRWLAGESNVRHYTADNGTVRSFCHCCGSSLTFTSPTAATTVIEVALGAFDDDIPVQPDAHIYVASKANWESINDDLPQFTKGRRDE